MGSRFFNGHAGGHYNDLGVIINDKGGGYYNGEGLL